MMDVRMLGMLTSGVWCVVCGAWVVMLLHIDGCVQ